MFQSELMMVLLIVKSKNKQLETSIPLSPTPNPKENIRSTRPHWLGFIRQSFIKKEEWVEL